MHNIDVSKLFSCNVTLDGRMICYEPQFAIGDYSQTNQVFSEKWKKNEAIGYADTERFQRNWYLTLYGFGTEEAFAEFLKDKQVILDAGCGLGHKAAWMAELAPHATVIGMDYSESAYIACERYRDIPNLYFVRGDISATRMRSESCDYVSCDQVIHHTEDPRATFAHLSDLLTPTGEFACYVYAKKALPRELLDDHFRTFAQELTHEQLWELSEQLTQLGKTLSELNVQVDVPDIPLLGIKGGNVDIQRFIYWNCFKCFWNPELGPDISRSANFDWYAPSRADRYSADEFKAIVAENALSIQSFHTEEACHSGRFGKVA